jgi:hypothetical protein
VSKTQPPISSLKRRATTVCTSHGYLPLPIRGPPGVHRYERPAIPKTTKTHIHRDERRASLVAIRNSEAIADAVVRLVELDGLPAAAAGDSEAMPRRTTEFVADLVEPAKAAALDKLDEGQRALGIAIGWLRAKLASAGPATSTGCRGVQAPGLPAASAVIRFARIR